MFKPGDRVLIKPGTKWYGYSKSNPADIPGTVLDEGLGICVRWDNEYVGTCFSEEDLILYGESLIFDYTENSRIVTTNSF